jgi:hypothetical protein
MPALFNYLVLLMVAGYALLLLIDQAFTSPVAALQPNGFKLYYMHGTSSSRFRIAGMRTMRGGRRTVELGSRVLVRA